MLGRVFSRLKTAILCLTVGLITCLSVTSCDRFNPINNSWDSADSAVVASMIDEALNPSFSSVGEILNYRNRMIEESDLVDVFYTIPDEVLPSVANVCINKFITTSRLEIAREYLAHREVYDNLVTNVQTQTEQISDTTATEGPEATIASEVSYHYRLDTVDGKPVKRLVEERTYDSK